MKKVIFLIIFVFGIFLFNNNRNLVTEDSIRFRVIANSNSSKDIMMKELVVSELSNVLFKDSSISETRNNIVNNLSVIEEKIDNLFVNNNYDKTYNILYGMNEFPRKEYNGVIYEEGLYESLVIEIGNAKGNNYWCFLYPSLCMIDYNNEEKIEYKSKIIEIFDNLF